MEVLSTILHAQAGERAKEIEEESEVHLEKFDMGVILKGKMETGKIIKCLKKQFNIVSVIWKPFEILTYMFYLSNGYKSSCKYIWIYKPFFI